MCAAREEANSRIDARLDMSTDMNWYFWEDCDRVDSSIVDLDKDLSVKSAVSESSGFAASARAIARPRAPFAPTGWLG